MKSPSRSLAFLALASQAFVACTSSGDSTTVRALAVDLELLSVPAPQPVTGDQQLLIYEIQVTQNEAAAQRIVSAKVTDPAGGATLSEYDAGEVRANGLFFTGALQPIQGDEPLLGQGDGALLYFYLSFPAGEAPPSALVNELTFADEDGKRATVELRFDVDSTPPVVVDPMVSAGYWLADGAPSAGSYHRRAALPVGGEIHLAQRYAIDLELMRDDGKLAEGDISDVKSWFGYGTDILAATDGVVVSLRSDLPDSTPPNFPDDTTLDNADGNYVIMQVAEGVYALYAHLVPDSVSVAVGQQVKRGDVLGKLGNSGNSLLPHLHFHLMDRPEALAAEGVPYVIRGFRDHGVATPIDEESGVWDWSPNEGTPIAERLPLQNVVIGFE